MRFLVYGAIPPGADPTPYLTAEATRVQELIADGTAEASYVRADRAGAYAVINTADRDAAQAVMQTMPLAQAGLLELTFVELGPPGP
jgi:hypothetical protein